MTELLEKIKLLNNDERAELAFKIQESFQAYNADFSESQKKDLDVKLSEHENGTDNASLFSDFFSKLKSKYGSAL